MQEKGLGVGVLGPPGPCWCDVPEDLIDSIISITGWFDCCFYGKKSLDMIIQLMTKWFIFLSVMPLHSRNQFFDQKGIKAPTAYKTGTTIVGLVYKVKNVLECDIYMYYII